MKKYNTFLAVLMLSALFVHTVQAADRPENVTLTEECISDLKLVGSGHELMFRKEFIEIFVTGSAKNSIFDPNKLEDVYWIVNRTDLTAKQAKIFIQDMNEERIQKGMLSTNAAGKTLFGGASSLTYSQILRLFLVGDWKKFTDEESIENEILTNFEVPGTPTAKRNAIKVLVNIIMQKQTNVGEFGFLLHEANQLADRLLSGEKSSENPSEQPGNPSEQPGQGLTAQEKEHIRSTLRSSTKDTFVSNLQTLVLDTNLENVDKALFAETQDIALDFLRRIVKDNTKWSGSTIILSQYAPDNKVTFDLLRKLIFAVELVYNDPEYNFEVPGGWTTNMVGKLHLFNFLVSHMNVKKGLTAVIGKYTAEQSETQQPKNLDELASQVNSYL